MADALRDVTVLCRGGLFTNEDALSLAGSNPGSAIRMLNMEISQFGGYRRVSGYVPFDSNHPSIAGKGPVLGVFILKDILYAARRNSADTTPTLGTNPLTVSSGSATISVAHSNHGLAVGNFVTFTGASAVGGITPNNVEMEVTGVPNANTYEVGFTSTASSSATGGGGSFTFQWDAAAECHDSLPGQTIRSSVHRAHEAGTNGRCAGIKQRWESSHPRNLLKRVVWSGGSSSE